MPTSLQTIGWWSRPTAYLERCRARYGRRFTIRLLGEPPFVEQRKLHDRMPAAAFPAEVLACAAVIA